MGLDLFRMLQDHYPEIWKHIFFVNGKKCFSLKYSNFIFDHNLFEIY